MMPLTLESALAATTFLLVSALVFGVRSLIVGKLLPERYVDRLVGEANERSTMWREAYNQEKLSRKAADSALSTLIEQSKTQLELLQTLRTLAERAGGRAVREMEAP